MRRRRAGGEDDGLGEALLPAGDASDAQQQQPQRAEPQQQRQQQPQHTVIVHRPFDIEAFLAFILARWTALLQAIAGCLRGLVGGGAPKLSLVQAARLDELQARVGVPYAPDNPLHREALLELWDLAFPGKPCPGLKGPEWKDMGWQGVDPATDFRAAGLLGLDNLLYMGRLRPRLFRDLQSKARGARSSWEYPFGAAGMNVTWALVDLLRLQPSGGAVVVGSGAGGGGGARGGGPASTAAGRGFLGLLSAHDAAFEELYCCAYELLDAVWLERGATYMEFNAVLGEVRRRVARALEARPGSVEALRAGVGLPPGG
ncbi:hypothetical protein Rsub_00915 [Raphidocelis subcapitata]|uniref:ELMO domain-containing protein n=1 Tax=Raphidocelis subcapitata TaxID=307507 RepID=A0A2V0NRL2_9CHLO|nr:hypothetical protein Rsub_00915 [Raphidocelis subcapitata]|eukprot:GBF88203.1 hypothetical protein Rsub_00915 [Raphidocelis subcapitata]